MTDSRDFSISALIDATLDQDKPVEVSIGDYIPFDELSTKAAILTAAPVAKIVVDDERSWTAIAQAGAQWKFTLLMGSDPSLRVLAKDLYGEAKGGGRRINGLFDDISDTHKTLKDLEELAAKVMVSMGCSPDVSIRRATQQIFGSIRLAAATLEVTISATTNLDAAVAAATSGGQGSLTEKYGTSFNHVADTFHREWVSKGLPQESESLGESELFKALEALNFSISGDGLSRAGSALEKLEKRPKMH